MSQRTILAIAIALVLSIPISAAEWRGRGFYEPDTARDVTDGWMYLEPDQDPSGQKVYFSAWAGQSQGGRHDPFNPNSAILGTQIMAYPTVMSAALGVWKDCNKDGYIGLPESLGMASPGQNTLTIGGGVATDPTVTTVERETGQEIGTGPGVQTIGNDTSYSVLLLPTTDVCPHTPDSPYNNGIRVREWLAIGPATQCTATPGEGCGYFAIPDQAARVWGDYGLPEEAAQASCALNPRPRGTYQSTGGFLRFADCFTNWKITGAVNGAAHTAGQDDLAFDDAPQNRPDQSASPLNRPNPWGQESDGSYVTAFDCGSRIEPTTDDPTGGQLSGDLGGGVAVFNGTTKSRTDFIAGTPATPGVNPSGSAAGTVNETGESNFVAGAPGRVSSGNFPGSVGEGSCDRNDDAGGTDSGQIYESLEGDLEGTAAKRVQTDHWFQPNFDEQFWQGRLGYVAIRNPYINRENLQPWGSVTVTTYATVTAVGVTMASGATGIYGADHCSGATEITGAFECDASKWYRGPTGADIAAKIRNPDGTLVDLDVRVGQAYHVRDIDCFDASARGVPSVTAMVGQLSCTRPS